MLKKTLLLTSGLLIIFLSSTLTRIDRTPYKALDFYKKSIHEINQLLTKNPSRSIGDTLLIGFARANLTPSESAPLAGYGNRRPKEMTSVHDSIYVNTTVINNGKNKIAIVSADLLIIPPEVTALLKEKLFNKGWSLPEIFLSATHTHSSLGGWAPGLVGNMIAGTYNAKYPEFIANQIVASIQMAEKRLNAGSWSFN
jgi:neutral ceramidase